MVKHPSRGDRHYILSRTNAVYSAFSAANLLNFLITKMQAMIHLMIINRLTMPFSWRNPTGCAGKSRQTRGNAGPIFTPETALHVKGETARGEPLHFLRCLRCKLPFTNTVFITHGFIHSKILSLYATIFVSAYCKHLLPFTSQKSEGQ